MKSLGFLIAFAVALTGCGEPASQPKGMLKENLTCPNGSHPEIERWGGIGENGWLQACKMKHGTFTAWRGESKMVEGEYINGLKEGVWYFWTQDGRKSKEITYKSNKEISKKEFK